MTAFGALLPTILLTAGLLAVLFADVFAKGRRPLLLPWISGTALTAVAVLALSWLAGDRGSDRVWFAALRMDRFAIVMTAFCSVAGLVSILATMVGEGDRRPGGEFHALVLAAVVGMAALSAAVDLVTLYLSFELVSITGYVLVGMRRSDRLANEASLKYVLFGAVSSGLMLYGLSLLVGLSGGTSLEALRVAVAAGASSQPVFVAACVLVFAGFAFKISAVPFQFWAPDVYQGAPAAVAGFLAVASKAAGFASLVRVVASLGAVPGVGESTASVLPMNTPMAAILAISAVLSMTVGNLAACRQNDLKRLLAYSSIAHAGYMLMALAIWSATGLSALVFYLVVYLFMNLAAFLLAGVVIRSTGSSSLESLRGLGFKNPWLAAAFTLVMLSLTGIPPLLGFLGKLVLFEAVIRSGYVWFAVIGLLNGAISLYYYAKPLMKMYLEDQDAGAAEPVRMGAGAIVLTCVLVLPVVAFFLYWSPLSTWARDVVPHVGLGS